jgi:hypothetical protein
MSEASVFGRARQIGHRQILVSGMRYDIPAGATHVLIRPVRRGNEIKIFIAFFRCGLPENYKPQNNTGKYFCRPDGAKQCLIEAYLRPSGWNYDVQWLTE